MVRSGWMKQFRETLSNTLVTQAAKRRSQARLPVQHAEYLEDRSLMSVSALLLNNTEMSIISDGDDDMVFQTNAAGQLEVLVGAKGQGELQRPLVPYLSIPVIQASALTSITIEGGSEQNEIDLSRLTLAAGYSPSLKIVVEGGNGHDIITGSVDVSNDIFGGDGNDTIRGGNASDTLDGGDGDDLIFGDVIPPQLSILAAPSDPRTLTNGADDAIQGGDGADTIHGVAGNDSINSGDGDDVVTSGIGNDSVFGGNGADSITGDDGDDNLNADGGFDTVVGGAGNDFILGGANNDRIYGDSDNPSTIGVGNDTVDGQAGNDTITGGGGIDSLSGGTGNDKVESTPFVTTTSDPLPVAVPNPSTGVPVALDNATPTGLATSDVGTFHTITTGNDDAGLIVTVDATGKFGSFSQIVAPNPNNSLVTQVSQFKGYSSEGAVFDPIGDGIGSVPMTTAVESSVYFRFGDITGPRVTLDQAAKAQGTIGNIFGTSSEGVSTFTIGNLVFNLTQQVQPQFDITTNRRIGSLLTQTYQITNIGTTSSTFELVRYFDGDLNFDGRDGLGGVTSNANGVPDGASPDGGGHLINAKTRDEFLFETEQGGVSNGGNFVGITATPNPAPPPAAFPTNRYELSLFPSLRTRLINGGNLTNQIANDANSDGSVDPGKEGNVSLALRNAYTLLSGATTTYTTHTVFGTGTPNQIQFNRGPSTQPDGADPNNPNDTTTPIVSLRNEPVTIDVVKNDKDVDGTLDFKSVQIQDLPAKGTVEVIGDGRIRYTPEPGTTGQFTFTYTVADNLGSRSIPTRVFIVVNPDPGSDNINGGLGNDTLVGADGNDTILAGGGDDSVFGGTGNDSIIGQGGNDSLVGGNGSDTIDGGIGNDNLASDTRLPPSLFINDVIVVEGAITPLSDGSAIANFTINLDHPVEEPVSFDYQLVSGTATTGVDFVAASGTLTLKPYETTINLPVKVLGDNIAELTERYTVVLSNLKNAQVGKAVGNGTILNNDLTLEYQRNGSRLFGDQNEVQIAINPTNPNFAVMVANDRAASFLNSIIDGTLDPALAVFTTVDGGNNWSPSPTVFDSTFDGIRGTIARPESRYSGRVAYDRAGNVHIVYVAEAEMPVITLNTVATGPTAIIYAISRDNGQSFQEVQLTPLQDGNLNPSIAVGPDAQNLNLDAVYVTYHAGGGNNNADSIVIRGGQVPPAILNLPPIQVPVPNFNAAAVISTTNTPNFPVATVGPNGEVAVSWETPNAQVTGQGPDTVNFDIDANGLLGGLGFRGNQSVTSTNVGSQDHIPATNIAGAIGFPFPTTNTFLVPSPPDEQAYASPQVAFDRSGGPHNGRLYLTYADEQANESDNIDIFIRFSDDNGLTFSSPIRVNDDIGFNSQFYQTIAVDQSNGVIVMGWYDARNDIFGGTADTDGQINTDVEYYATASYDGGVTWMPNVKVSSGPSNGLRNFINTATGSLFGNYTGITAANGVILAAWADNSNSSGDNPDGNLGFDAYVARLSEATVGLAAATAFPTQLDPADVLLGGEDNDTLTGGDSADTLNGQGGNDLLFGKRENDLLLGGAGDDTLDGGYGNDTVLGQGGNDLVNGGHDEDVLQWFGATDGNDTMFGTSGADQVQVLGDGSANTLNIAASGPELVVSMGLNSIITAPTVNQLSVSGLGGDDQINVGDLSGVRQFLLTVNGDAGNDLLTAAGQNSGGVRLILNGGDGADTLVGGKGRDTLFGGRGNDRLFGGDNNDSLSGEGGNDVVDGQAGNDTVIGDTAADTIIGATGGGNDTLFGSDGNDSLIGGGGADSLDGGVGADTLQGNDGADSLNGAAGNDSLLGGAGTDNLAGGIGDDTINGGRNNDSIAGNGGNDLIFGDHGNDYINAGDGNDSVNGGDGNDTIIGGAGNDALFGADGDDFINAGDGDDVVIGGDGDDTLLGGTGNDLILGRDGKDNINGQGGGDTVAGNEGADSIIADPGEINEAFSILTLGRSFLAKLGVKV